MALEEKTGRYREITLKCDSRGNLGKKIAAFFLKHPQLAKKYQFKLINNQPQDLIVEMHDPAANLTKVAVWEFKFEDDLWASIKSKRLQKEITETYMPMNAEIFYCWAIGLFNQQSLESFISIIDEYYPHVRAKIYESFDAAFVKLLKMITVQNFTKTVIVPVDYRMQNKSMVQSLAQICNGITTDLAAFIFSYEGYSLDSLEAIVIMNKENPQYLKAALEEIFFVYYEEEQPALADKLMAALKSKYNQNIEQNGEEENGEN